LVQLQIQNGRQTITHKVIKPPSGFLGGIGRKFASIIIGLNSHNEKESKLIKISSEKISNKEWHITVLADKWLQRWSVNSSGTAEQFLCEDLEVLKKIREMYHQKYWNNHEITEIQLWLLDMQSTDRGVIILAAALNEQHTPNIIYTLVTMVSENDTMVIKEVNQVKYKGFYNPEKEREYLGLKFVANRGVAYLYNAKMILPVLLNATPSSKEDVEKIEFHNQNDTIMAAGCHQNVPLFFTKVHGFVCVTPSDFDAEMFNVSMTSDVFNVSSSMQLNDSVLSPSTTNVGNLLMYDLDPEQILEEGMTEMASVVKAAFVYHLKRNPG
jgi:nuclear pore complex protein Nup133